MEEFIKKLSIETPLSYAESKCMMEIINSKAGNIETAKKIYERDGVYALITYRNQLSFGVIY